MHALGPHEGEHQGTPGWLARHSPEPDKSHQSHMPPHIDICLHTPRFPHMLTGEMAFKGKQQQHIHLHTLTQAGTLHTCKHAGRGKACTQAPQVKKQTCMQDTTQKCTANAWRGHYFLELSAPHMQALSNCSQQHTLHTPSTCPPQRCVPRRQGKARQRNHAITQESEEPYTLCTCKLPKSYTPVGPPPKTLLYSLHIGFLHHPTPCMHHTHPTAHSRTLCSPKMLHQLAAAAAKHPCASSCCRPTAVAAAVAPKFPAAAQAHRSHIPTEKAGRPARARPPHFLRKSSSSSSGDFPGSQDSGTPAVCLMSTPTRR